MPGSQKNTSPNLKLILENIGPIKRAEIELGGVTVLYGANATGKTTVAKSIEYLIKLTNNINVNCDELMELIRYDARVGRIVLNDYEVLLERSGEFENVNVVIKRGAETLHSGGCGAGAYSTGLHIANLALAWVKYDRVIVIQETEDVLGLRELFNPSIAGKYISVTSSLPFTLRAFEDYLYDASHVLNSLTGFHITVLAGDVFFDDGDHLFTPNNIAEGVKRTAMIIAVKFLAERLRKLGKLPIIFVEGLEPLHIDTIEGILDELSEGNVPVIVETHSAFAIKYSFKKNWNVYVLKDGTVHSDLTKPELFDKEAVVASEVGEIL